MRTGSRLHRQLVPALRAVALVLLVGALLAPKVSLALASALGNGYTSVVICTGGGLARVTISPDGDIVEDVSERWSAAHCVLNDAASERLARAWQRIDWPRYAAVATRQEPALAPPPQATRPAVSSRGPPHG